MTKHLERRQAELIARRWVGSAGLVWPHLAEVARQGRELTDAERFQIAGCLLLVARLVMDRSEETGQEATTAAQGHGPAARR